MKRERKRWVQFWSPGLIVADSWTKDVELTTQPEDVDWPEAAYAFDLYERDDVIDDQGMRYQGKPWKVGPTYYHPDSRVEDLVAVTNNPHATRMLIENMRGNDWTHVIWTRWGTWPQPFDPAKARVL